MSSPVSREEFVEQVVQIIRQRFPLVKVAAGDEEFTLSVNGAIAPLENLYRSALIAPEQLQHSVERWAVELLRAAEGTPDQSAGFDDVKERILPMVVGANGNEESAKEFRAAGVISQPLVEGLNVAYAIDNDRTIAYIPRGRFESWGIALEELHELAIENLLARSESIEIKAAPPDEQGRVHLLIFQTLDGYDASRILLPTLHEQLREHLGSPFAAAIPNRDIMLCFRDETDTVERLAKQIAEDYQRMPHQVTDRLLLVTADGIAVRENA